MNEMLITEDKIWVHNAGPVTVSEASRRSKTQSDANFIYLQDHFFLLCRGDRSLGGDKRTDGFQDPREFSLSMVARWLSWKWETGVLEILVLSSSAATASLLSPTFPFFSTSIHLSVHLYMLPKPISLFFFSLLFSENYANFRHPIWNVEWGFSKSP